MRSTLARAARRAREAALTGARAAGALERWADSEWRRRRLLILCYHGVSLRDEHEWDSELFVSPNFLRRRLSMLRDGGYSVLPLGEAVQRLQSATLPSRAVVLTFDDGFYNFAAGACPVLEEYGFPATVYLSTYHCINQRPLLRLLLHYLLWQARSRTLASRALPGQPDEVDLGSADERARLGDRLHELAQAPELLADRDSQLEWVSTIATSLGVDLEGLMRSRLFHLLAPEDVAEIARRGIDVQLHTHRHRTPRESQAFSREVLENRGIIQPLTGRPAVHFCYPSGDVDKRFFPWLREAGVISATTCESGLAHPASDNLRLPRYIDTMRQSDVMFSSWLSGAAELLQGRFFAT